LVAPAVLFGQFDNQLFIIRNGEFWQCEHGALIFAACHARHYNALNEQGEKVGAPFKSSLFGKSVGIEALEKRIEKSAEVIRDKGLKDRPKRIISAALRTARNRRDFEAALSKQNITAIFRANEDGRIYGATFIDHEQKCVFNGSRLGKEFSANVFHDLFNQPANYQINTISPNRPNCPISPPSPQFLPPSNSFENPSHDRETHGSDTTGSIFDFFSSGAAPTTDYEEEAFTRRLKKRKKKPQKSI
jgi:hypothetical protein